MKWKQGLVGILGGVLFLGSQVFAGTVTMGDVQGTYSAYRLFSAADGETAYTVEDAYRKALVQTAPSGFDANQDGQLSDAELVAGFRGAPAWSLRGVADALVPLVSSQTPDAVSEGSAFSDLPAGYYLFVRQGGGEFATMAHVGLTNVSLGMKEGIPTVSSHFVLSEMMKGRTTTLSKGERICVEYSVIFPDYVSAWTDFGLTLHTEGEGFRAVGTPVLFVNGQEVTVSGEELPADDGCLFHLSVNRDGRTLLRNGAELPITNEMELIIKMEYELTEDANTKATGNGLRTHVNYSSDPYDATKTADTVVDKVTAFSFQVQPVSVNEEGEVIPGAAYTLYEKQGDDWKEVDATRISAGIYKLVETQAPEGYDALPDLTFTLRADYGDLEMTELRTFVNGKEDLETFSTDLAEGIVNVWRVHTKAGRFPLTGSGARRLLVATSFGFLGIGTAVMLRDKNKRMG